MSRSEGGLWKLTGLGRVALLESGRRAGGDGCSVSIAAPAGSEVIHLALCTPTAPTVSSNPLQLTSGNDPTASLHISGAVCVSMPTVCQHAHCGGAHRHLSTLSPWDNDPEPPPQIPALYLTHGGILWHLWTRLLHPVCFL